MYKVPLGFMIELVSDGTGSVDVDLTQVPVSYRLAGPNTSGPPAFRFPKLTFPNDVVGAFVQGFTLLTASLPTPGLLHIAFSGSGPTAGQEVTLSGSFYYNVD
jgi:hypothetical protein